MEHAGFQHRALIYEGADEYLAGTAPGRAERTPAEMEAPPARGAAQPRLRWLANQLCELVQIRSGTGGTVARLHMLAGQHVTRLRPSGPGLRIGASRSGSARAVSFRAPKIRGGRRVPPVAG